MVQDKPASIQQHYDFLDGLRAILALYVVAHHAMLMSGTHSSVFFRALAYGRGAVCFFIVLSGFCLALPVLKSDFRISRGVSSFFRRRAWRILPPYYLALAFSLLAVALFVHNKTGTFWDLSLPVTARDILLHLLLLQNFSGSDYYRINTVFWTISVEWQIYFFFPLLLWGWRTIGAISTTVVTVIASMFVEFGAFHFRFGAPSANFLGLFALGMLAAYIGISPSKSVVRYQNLPWKLTAIVMCVLLFYLYTIPLGTARLMEDLAFGCLASSLLVIVVLKPSGWLRGFLDFKPLAFVGSFSYSLYLIHAPLMQILWQYGISHLGFGPDVTGVILLVFGTPLLVATAYLFFLVGERPFLQKKGRKIAHIP